MPISGLGSGCLVARFFAGFWAMFFVFLERNIVLDS